MSQSIFWPLVSCIENFILEIYNVDLFLFVHVVYGVETLRTDVVDRVVERVTDLTRRQDRTRVVQRRR